MATDEAKDQLKSERRSLENVRERILAYEHEIKQYLDKLDATVDYYKFSVEKRDDGVTVEVAVKATVSPRSTPYTSRA